MTKSKKGVKGFQELPKEIKKTERGVFYLSPNQMLKLKTYCTSKDISPSELIRERLKDVIG